VLVGRGELVEPAYHLVPAHRLFARLEQEGGHDTEGDRGQHAECAEPHPRRVEKVWVPLGRAGDHLPVREHQLKLRHLRRDRTKVTPGAVGAGLDGARDGLLLDIAHVGERKPAGEQRLVEHSQRAAGLRRGKAGLAVHRPDPPQALWP
jgi:hypothetical protein